MTLILSGKHNTAFAILHGGAHSEDDCEHQRQLGMLLTIAHSNTSALNNPNSLDIFIKDVLICMEDSGTFNAGKGAVQQSDGLARHSAAVMDGETQTFSGIANLVSSHNPAIFAHALQSNSSRVITESGHELLASELGLESLLSNTAHTSINNSKTDTVGCVAMSDVKQLYAGTSTGGVSDRFPGRMSDCVSVAGNYASKFLAVGATGIGEEIVDDAVCARLETRVRDGMSLSEASQRCFDEALARNRDYGWIAIDSEGNWSVAHVSKFMPFVVMDKQQTVLSQSEE